MNRIFKAVAILTLPLLAVSCAPKETAQVVEKERVEVVETSKLTKPMLLVQFNFHQRYKVIPV